MNHLITLDDIIRYKIKKIVPWLYDILRYEIQIFKFNKLWYLIKKINNNINISIFEIESSNTLPEDCYSVKSA